MYKQADIYLLDDPLSAVDTRVGKYLFEKCIKGYIKYNFYVIILINMFFKFNRLPQRKVLCSYYSSNAILDKCRSNCSNGKCMYCDFNNNFRS